MAAIRSIISSASNAAASESLDGFVSLMENAEAAGDWQAVGDFDLAFRVALVDASGSPRLKRMSPPSSPRPASASEP